MYNRVCMSRYNPGILGDIHYKPKVGHYLTIDELDSSGLVKCSYFANTMVISRHV
jgi:hypothetical protein